MTTTPHYIGIDIAKQSLDISCSSLGLSLSLPNDPKGLRKLIAILTRSKVPIHIICEASGGYERSLLDALWNAKIPLSLINPRWIRAFANAHGQYAKTDAIDARLLAIYGKAFNPEPTPPPSQTSRSLSSLISRRDELKAARQTESNRKEHTHGDKFISKQINSHIKFLDNQIAQVQAQIDLLLEQDSLLKQKVDCLCKVKGIGSLSAVTFLAHMPELGSLDRNQAAALAGVCPYNCDSGPFKGQRFIRGGRAAIRKSLYMAALVACSHNPILRDFYQRLIAKGKPAKVAITAVMRKLIILINRLLKKFSPLPV